MEKLFESDLHSGFHAIFGENGSVNNSSVARLFDIKVLKNIQDKIAEATDLAFVTVDYWGKSITEMTSFTPFRQQVHKDENAKRICMSSDMFGAIQITVTQKTYVYSCPYGLIEIAVPIIIRGHYLGGFIGEQIRCGDAPTDICQMENALHHDHNHRGDPKVDQLFESVTVCPHEEFFHIANLVFLIVSQLAEKGSPRLVQKENLGKELEVLNKQKKEMGVELAILKTQVNPYFLFKSLNAISNLSVVEDAPRTDRAINLFAEFMKFSFSGTGDNVFISDEIGNLERCLKIQKERVGGQLQYVLDISDELSMQKIPSRILLPFVERAVFYGVGQKKKHGTLRIVARYQGDDVVLQVEDDGPGFSDRRVTQLFRRYKGSYGGGAIETSITLSRQRLVNSFGTGYDAVIKNVGGVGIANTIHYPGNFDEKANRSCIKC